MVTHVVSHGARNPYHGFIWLISLHGIDSPEDKSAIALQISLGWINSIYAGG
jgi:hypothetical protein